MRLDEPPSRRDQVVEALTNAILTGERRGGDRLVERELAEQLGVSKTPVREALKVLEQRGLATSSAFHSCEVTTVDAAFARGVYGVRIMLEPAAVRAAVPAHSPETLGAISATLAEAAAAIKQGDLAELSLINRRLHQALYHTCPNPFLRAMTDELQYRVALISVAGWKKRWSGEGEFAEHRAIRDAIEAGDAEQAEALVRAHIGQFLVGLENENLQHEAV